ncbi:hypothetical protein [Propioniciclava soli]|uniref:Uncharacterized protein n=1 Tax=Propioniciclava soli TaxID=2775081 RepID=A0ABZ3C3I4_9ACTN|nr:hypothetical protein [Propioniciclava soli]
MPTTRRPLVTIVADADDTGARATAQAVALAAGCGTRHTVWLVPTDALARGRWHHTVDPDGTPRTHVEPWPHRRSLADDQVGVVWFRSRCPAVTPSHGAGTAADRAYAATELAALFSSWLLGLGDRVVTRPEGTSPAGAAWDATVWRALAAARGAAVSTDPASRRVLVAGDRVVGAATDAEATLARDLAEQAASRCFELTLDAHGRVVDAGVTPALTGPGHVAAAAGLLLRLAARGVAA